MRSLLLALTLCLAAACHSQPTAGTAAKVDSDGMTPRLPPATPADTMDPAWMPTDAAARVAILTGRLDPAEDSNFVALPAGLTDGDQTYLLRRATADAVTRMIAAAAADGVTFQVVSATRNFDRQAQIWGAKWRGERTLSNGVNLGTADLSDSAKARMILLYSSMPGTSRHHWGTDLDLNELEPAYWTTGRGAEEYAWLQAHAADYGFFQPYTSKARGRTGYEEERWHWSYAPLSRPLLHMYEREVGYEHIGGFDGAASARDVNAIEEYVGGIGD